MTELTSVIEFDVDLNDVEAPQPLPAGTYNAVILTAESMLSKANNLMAKVTFSISADQYPVDYVDGNPNGTTLTYYVGLSPDTRTMFLLKQFISAIGAPMSKSVDLNTWLGLGASVEVINEPYQGTMTARIKKVIA